MIDRQQRQQQYQRQFQYQQRYDSNRQSIKRENYDNNNKSSFSRVINVEKNNAYLIEMTHEKTQQKKTFEYNVVNYEKKKYFVN